LAPDGFIVANDVLAIINYINAKGSGPIPASAPFGPAYPDVDADDQVVAQDVLDVINWINAHPGQSEGEATGDAAPDSTASSDSYFDALAADQAATTAQSALPAAVAATSSQYDLVSLIATDIATTEAKRRRL
jgi:hypothetical protein